MQCQAFFQDPHVLRPDNQNQYLLTQGGVKALPDSNLTVKEQAQSEHALSVQSEHSEVSWLDEDVSYQ